MSPEQNGAGSTSCARVRIELWTALASRRSGRVFDCSLEGAPRERLESLAMTVPDLCANHDSSTLERFWEQVGSEGRASAFNEIVLLSPEYVHVIQPLTKRPSLVLLVIGSAQMSIGLILSAVRAKVAELEVG